MKYKYENWVINELEELEDEYKISYKNEIDEVRKVYCKAKVFDKVRSFITKRLKEEETTDEYDYGERFMCEEIKRLLEDE